jgi:hypothetical protein
VKAVTPSISKPLISEVNRERARRNIAVKVELLARVAKWLDAPVDLANSISAERRLFDTDTFPKSLRQFNSWTSDALPSELAESVPNFQRNANATLNLHAPLYASAQTAINAVAKHRLLLTRRPKKERSLERLVDRLHFATTQRQIAERELSTSLLEIADLRNEVLGLRRQYAALQREARGVAEALASEIEKGRGSLSKGRSVGKVVPLQGRDNEP